MDPGLQEILNLVMVLPILIRGLLSRTSQHLPMLMNTSTMLLPRILPMLMEDIHWKKGRRVMYKVCWTREKQGKPTKTS